MAKRRVECSKLHCYQPPFHDGLCKRHFEEHADRERRRERALTLLDSSRIDGEMIPAGPLREEFWKVRDWWGDVCNHVNSDRKHPILRDETRFGVEWCIGLADLIAEEEVERRAGHNVDVAFNEYKRRELWQRFENLERGLMSNGVARPADRR